MFGSSVRYLLTQGVNRALAEWFSYRESSRELNRWFQARTVNALDRHTPNCWIVGNLLMAVSEHADGIAFSQRQLRGVMSWETSGSFWTLDASPGFPEPSDTAAEMEYLIRYRYMSRIDIYHIIQGEALLRGGVPNTFEPDIDALRNRLKIPRRVAIASDADVVQCEFSLASDTRFRVCPLLHVDINYPSEETG